MTGLEFVRGPLCKKQLRDKFFDCGKRACAPHRLEPIFGALRSLDGDTQAEDLLGALRGAFQESAPVTRRA